MNYVVEDLSSLMHTDDLMSGMIDPDDITYGINGATSIEPIPTNIGDIPPPDWSGVQQPQTRQSGGGFSMDNIDPEMVNAAISTTGTLIGMAANSSKKTEVERQLKATCGRRPRIGKARKEAYRKCANEALQTLMGFNTGFGTGRSGMGTGGWDSQPPRQGVSTGAVIGIVAGGVLLTAVIVLATKKKA